MESRTTLKYEFTVQILGFNNISYKYDWTLSYLKWKQKCTLSFLDEYSMKKKLDFYHQYHVSHYKFTPSHRNLLATEINRINY